MAAAVGAAAAPAPLWAGQEDRSRWMGVSAASYAVRWRASRRGSGLAPGSGGGFGDTIGFIEHCHAAGAGGVQAGLSAWEPAFAERVRRRVEELGMHYEAQLRLPRDEDDVERFDHQAGLARRAGAAVARSVMLGGRRYEVFETAEQFERFAERSRRSLELAEPVVRRHGLRLAMENHKDWRAPEMLEILGRLGSEWVGVCIDTGNSIALLEAPMTTVEAFAPVAFSVHLKDMAVREYEGGFLLSEVPLGQGLLDLPEIVRTIRQAHAEVHFELEMITRDPLRVPCLTDKYWATFEKLPGKHLARTLAMVRAHAWDRPLPRISGLTPEQQIEAEERNVRESVAYGREHLGL